MVLYPNHAMKSRGVSDAPMTACHTPNVIFLRRNHECCKYRFAFEINEEELSEFVRAEIDGSDFGCLMSDVVSEALSDWDFDQMESEIQELDSRSDRLRRQA